MKITRARSLKGIVNVPGDKSISHRAVMLASAATGETVITNFSASADCHSTVGCMRALGVTISVDGTTVTVSGRGGEFSSNAGVLDCGNSGTTMRLLTGLLSGFGVECELTGDDSLRGRPMGRVIEPLTQMGGVIESEGGKAPLRLRPNSGLNAIRYATPVASAQIKSCVLLAGLNAEGRTVVVESSRTRDHTERMLRHFGVSVEESVGRDGFEIAVVGGSQLQAADIQVPGDISSATFFIAAAAGLAGSEIRLNNVGLNPSRSAIIEIFRKFGAEVEITNEHESSGEPVGDVLVRGAGSLSPAGGVLRIDGPMVGDVIDEIPALAVLGTQIDGGIEVRDAAELRVKESDRISAVVENLRRMGAAVEEFPDGLRVQKSTLRGAEVDSFGDHRIAMAFAVAGLFADGETTIAGAECADVSFPGFFDELKRTVGDQVDIPRT